MLPHRALDAGVDMYFRIVAHRAMHETVGFAPVDEDWQAISR